MVLMQSLVVQKNAHFFTMAELRGGRVKIYNVKMVKTELASGAPKLCQNQKSFRILSN